MAVGTGNQKEGFSSKTAPSGRGPHDLRSHWCVCESRRTPPTAWLRPEDRLLRSRDPQLVAWRDQNPGVRSMDVPGECERSLSSVPAGANPSLGLLCSGKGALSLSFLVPTAVDRCPQGRLGHPE